MKDRELNTMIRAYGVLQGFETKWEQHHTVEGQSLLCSLRDTIAPEIGASAHATQDAVHSAFSEFPDYLNIAASKAVTLARELTERYDEEPEVNNASDDG